jgi:tyrosinase
MLAMALLPGCASIATRPTEVLPLVEIEINNTASTVDDYITWSPTQARIRIANGNNVSGPYTVVLQNMNTGLGAKGQMQFGAQQSPWPPPFPLNPNTLTLTLPQSGAWVPFAVSGVTASERDKDAVIEVKEDRTDGVVLGRKALMVRIRKNANTLSEDERRRFLNALATLNLQMNNYDVFRAVHAVAGTEAHSLPAPAHAFLPWHRAFILRIERELQAIDPSVALPYWKFDEAAPNVFHPDFMGVTNSGNVVTFSSGNPLFTWATLGTPGVVRSPTFGPASSPPSVIKDATTLALGNLYGAFRQMEVNPHNQVHNQAGGVGNWISGIAPAVRDPLFFLLHANVDRLWAKWQWNYAQHNATLVGSYTLQGNAPTGNCPALGQYALDTMWPWNGATTSVDPCRPSIAPGGAFPLTTPALLIPPAQPRPADMVEYRRGGLNGSGAGFAYDDVPFTP